MSAHVAVLDVQTTGTVLPPWWTFKSGSLCRPGAMVNADFVAGPFGCLDYWQGSATSGLGIVTIGLGGPNRERITAFAVVPAGDPHIVPIAPGTEVYSFKLIITNSRTVGTCPGCLEGACIVFNNLQFTQIPSAGVRDINFPATSNHVTWRGGLAPGLCPAVTPARSPTWGAIKAIYR